MTGFIGQEKWQQFFSVAIRDGALHHAYLFSGSSHIGKKTFIHALARTLLGGDGEQGTTATHPDLLVLTDEGEGTISIELVRQFIMSVASTPLSGQRRVALIPEAERLTLQGWNALLKTLEEPPTTTVFLLAAEKPQQLPATVRSRLQQCRFVPVPAGVLSKELQTRGATHALAEELAAVSGGRPGIALRWFAEPDHYAAYKKSTSDFLQLCQGSIAERLAFTETVAKETSMPRADLLRLLDTWTMVLRDGLFAALGEQELIIHRYLLPGVTEISPQAAVGRWHDALVSMGTLRRRLETYGNRRLALNTFFFTLSV
ncbi:MAG: hypothetical protein WC817_03740 [Patescibacteria group bacterium]|jgi:DNA polymerase-3 subunit delta'